MPNNEIAPARKPRLAIMGEFSSGKSTLTNLFLGQRPLPEQVTATRLAPVWISKGSASPYRQRLDGVQEPISLETLGQVPIEDTHSIRLFFEADVLDMCDIIDIPGISDPNMDAEVWQRMIDEVDVVLWCTHATQAWRQSESAAWDLIPAAVQKRSGLLLTRFDKLANERDRGRVLARVKHETDGKFGNVFPMKLLKALNAGDDTEAWEDSGAAALLEHLGTILAEFEPGESGENTANADRDGETGNVTDFRPRSTKAKISDIQPKRPTPEGQVSVLKVMPRRISTISATNADNPRRDRPENSADLG